jgi:hypothetical protein
LLARDFRRSPAITPSEVLRLIVCQSCGVESEGPFSSGDYVFRTVGECPRCKGTLYIKALYSSEAKAGAKKHKPAKKPADATR